MTASRSRPPRKDAPTLPLELDDALKGFLADLVAQDGFSPNTIDAYRRDVDRFLHHLAERSVTAPGQAGPDDVADLLVSLRDAGLSLPTMARNLTSVKSFYRYLNRRQPGHPDPTAGLEPPRQERKLPDVLSLDEIERLLDAPDPDTPLGRRDRALLELLYATGMRVSELIPLRQEQLMLDTALVRVISRGPRERLVPLGRRAIERLRLYLERARPQVADPTEPVVFLNARGGHLSRMGIWKINRAAAEQAGIERKISPHTLRHSFAAHLLDGGANLRDVQELLGHSDLASTQVYARIDSRRLKEIHQTYHPRG
jgi:integrase/recombinase XerD